MVYLQIQDEYGGTHLYVGIIFYKARFQEMSAILFSFLHFHALVCIDYIGMSPEK